MMQFNIFIFKHSIICSHSGAADIPDCENVRKLVQCLREVRHQKTLDGLKLIDGDPLKVTCHHFIMNLNPYYYYLSLL